ncbi:MAG: hypothetical protein GYB68_09785, partial [Chloroflexi bacterium]|nr:hypothetical protein [Chloroflexota bacterium]
MSSHASQVRPAPARETVRITLITDDGSPSVWDAPVGITLDAFFQQAQPHWTPPSHPDKAIIGETVMAALVDNELRGLEFPVKRDVTVKPVSISHTDGLRIYRRSLTLLLLAAINDLFPGTKIAVTNSLPSGGYVCEVRQGTDFSAQQIEQIEGRMRELVEVDEPIVRQAVPKPDANALAQKNGDQDKLRLYEARKQNYVTLYELNGITEFFAGYLAPSTGYLTAFFLSRFEDNFVLSYPGRGRPLEIEPPQLFEKMRGVYQQTTRWLQLLDLSLIH